MKTKRIIHFFIATGLLVGLQSCNEPETDSQIQWDFSNQEEIQYDFRQELEDVEYSSTDTLNQKVNGTGVLLVTPKNDSLADLTQSKLSINVTLEVRDSTASETMTPPDMVIPNMTNRGKFLDSNTHILFRILFPMPSGELGIDETSEQHLNLPVNVYGKILPCEGFIKVTRKQPEEYEGIPCEVLYAEFRLDELNIPATAVDQYNYEFYGSGTYYFDPATNKFLAGDMVSFGSAGYQSTIESEDASEASTQSESTYHYQIRK
jgi:hypothetical protein